MKVERRDGADQRAILIGMAVDKAVVRGIAARLRDNEELFDSRWSNLVAGWIIQHYRKYGKAPGRALETYFDRWATANKNPDVVRLVEKFLAGLSKEYERNGKAPSADYLLDVAGRYFQQVQLRNLKEEIEGCLESGEVEKAGKLVTEFRKVEVGTTAGISVFKEIKAVKEAFDAKGQSLIKFHQPATDNFFGHMLAREELIVFMGKAKIGKSWYTQEMVWRSALNGLKVAFFECGDQSRNQLLRRLGCRAAQIPIWLPDQKHKPVRWPSSIECDEADRPKITHEEKSFDHELTWEESRVALRKMGREHGEDNFHLSVHPNNSLTATKIETILDDWYHQEDFLPDVVVVDYPDIMAPMDGRMESRDQINATWKSLRRLNQQLHCLMILATQASAASYDAELIRRKHFADDRRKFDHCTGCIGINQTDREKEAGLYRLNWVLGRDLDFPEDKCLHIAHCLSLAQPMVCSTFAGR